MRNRKPERLVESFNGNMYENITAICKHYGFENKFGIPVLAVALYIKNKEKIVKITEENLIFMGLLIVLDDFAKYASETTVEASSKKIITEHTFFYDESLKDIVKKFSGEDFYWENLKEVAVKVPCDLLHLSENVDFWIKLKIANIDSINLLFDILLDWKKIQSSSVRSHILVNPLFLRRWELPENFMHVGQFQRCMNFCRKMPLLLSDKPLFYDFDQCCDSCRSID